MSTILVVDDMAMCREPIAEALRAQGHTVTCADGGAEAIKILQNLRPDVVLLDVTMPEPDGLAVLGIIRRNPNLAKIPVILLTDRAEKGIVTQAAKCGVQGYLLKANFSLETLLARVNACVGKAGQETAPVPRRAAGGDAATPVGGCTKTAATSPPAVQCNSAVMAEGKQECAIDGKNGPVASLQDLRPVITKEALTKLVNDGMKLRPLAATVQNVMAVTGNAGCSGTDVAKAVSKDQALCIRLLKLANSSAYARGRPVDSVQMAVQRIGVQEVRKLVMTLGVVEHYAKCKSGRFDIRLFWEHSIACGLIAAALARECQFKAVDDCFLWGTVHDVGRVILLDHVPNEYTTVCNTADELEVPLESVEPHMLLLDHCQILKRALEHWQFPHAFIVPVVNHHGSVKRLQRLGPEHQQAAMIVALANRIAHSLLLGCSGNEAIYPLGEFTDALGIPASTIEKIADTIPQETRDLKFAMLAHSTTDEWPDFGAMVRARFDAPVRPLCVSKEPANDAFRLFLARVGEVDGTEPPNLGVISLCDPREAASLYSEYQKLEAAADCGALPLLVIFGTGAARTSKAPWQGRQHTVLEAPVPIGLLQKTVQEALLEVVAT